MKMSKTVSKGKSSSVAKSTPKAPQRKTAESLAQFKKRIGGMDREKVIKEAEDLLGDEPF